MRSIYNSRLAAALKAREDFLESLNDEQRAQALAFQQEITAKLKTAGSTHNRLVLIQQMMFDSLLKLELELKKLSESVVEGIHVKNGTDKPIPHNQEKQERKLRRDFKNEK